ncbi:MAG: YceH family protein [Bryobacteraceae bacterium]|nr:YceH family protein [Bryobacteraceae bacterium]
MAAFALDDIEIRVLGALSEKDLATPEYYPLSLNALVSACNQKTNREPVTDYDETAVHAALHRLEQQGWVRSVLEHGSRVTKYRHLLVERLELRRSEQAVLTVLLLRGPQTAGELRTRAERLHEFSDLDAVLNTLRRLAEREPEPLVVQLERLPGMKENRWMHRFGAEPVAAIPPQPHKPPLEQRLEQLEAAVDELRGQLRSLQQQLEALAGGSRPQP